MADIFKPSLSTITISGSTVTTYVKNFSEIGGGLGIKFIKTFNRKYKVSKAERENYEVSFDISITNDDFNTIFNNGATPQTIVLTGLNSTNTYTITYSNSRPSNFNHEFSADGYLVGTINFLVPPYDDLGSDNRSISYS